MTRAVRKVPTLCALATALLLWTCASADAAHSWTASTTFTSPGPQTSLGDVWCGSTSDCVVVGADASGLFAERFGGSGWTPQRMPSVGTVDTGTGLLGVSCTSDTFCMAVGTASGCTPVAMRWDGRAWTAATQGLPTGDCLPGDTLVGVSCASPAFCLALDRTQGPGPIAWNGTAWTPVAIPRRITRLHPFFNTVSCPAVRRCALGGGTRHGALVAFWNRSKWTSYAETEPAGSTDQVSRVSCATRRFCLAVATDFNRVNFSYEWTGTRWSGFFRPPGGLHSILYRVSCPAVRTCMALTAGYEAVAVSGATWLRWGAPFGPGSSTPSGISCVTGSACMVVGTIEDGGEQPDSGFVATTGFPAARATAAARRPASGAR